MPKIIAKAKRKENGNGHLPTAAELREVYRGKVLTEDEKELLRATRAAMKALAKEQEKYGNRLETCL